MKWTVRMALSRLLGALILSTVLSAAVAAARAVPVPDDGVLQFDVVRKGEPIGTQVLTFQRNSGRLDVTVKTRIAVKIAFITAYRFEYDGHEVWQDGKLIEMETSTDDDGTAHTLTVSADDEGELRVVGDGKEMQANADAIPATLWNPASVRTRDLMDALVGKHLEVAVADVGDEIVTARGKPVKAHHYSMTGELARELWYDEDGVLVRMTLKGKDGSDVAYVLR
jgi:Domain of unknown function (DUF6134)